MNRASLGTPVAMAMAASEQGRTIQVRMTFTDDADNEETLTSAFSRASASVTRG